MTHILLGIAIILIGGMVALMLGRTPRSASIIAPASVLLGSIVSALPVTRTLIDRSSPTLTANWPLPLGRFSVGLDPLSAFFLIPILILAPLAAIYGASYLNREHDRHRIGAHWLFFNLLVVGMHLLLIARDGILFLIAWELMAVSSFFLVVFDDRKSDVRDAGWTYLVASHIGAAPLLLFFAFLGSRAGSFDFSQMATVTAVLPFGSPIPSLLFIAALIGFGTKAGIIPLHVWLPEAHPAAPSHISAIMSGVMIKTGIYGLIRALMLIGPPTAAVAWTLIGLGIASGIAGVVLALAQHDIKRLLAYHSVENIGIILLGLGVGFLGLSRNNAVLAIAGLSGGLLHVLNHALFKSLLFFGAGAVAQATGLRAMNRLGGLLRRMPWTGFSFIVGAAAISALPPFNGFVSEFLIFFGTAAGSLRGSPSELTLGIAVLGGLGLIGGLAAACFTKCAGLVFLGEPRSREARHAHETSLLMRLPMLILALLCLAIGLGAPFAFRLVSPVVESLTGLNETALAAAIEGLPAILGRISGISLALIALAVLLWSLRRRLPARHLESTSPTWDCGYADPTPRMQYTPSSYATPLTLLFRSFLGTHVQGKPVEGDFPAGASFASHTPDFGRRWIFEPLFRGIDRVLAPIRLLQHGRIHLYILYIAITLIGLLIWKVGMMP